MRTDFVGANHGEQVELIANEGKFGSNLVTNEDGVDFDAIGRYVEGFVESEQTEQGLIVVTSGAVVAGEQRARQLMSEGDRSNLTLRQKASLGCTAMFGAWETAFGDHGVATASFAITHHQLMGPRWYNNILNRDEKLSFKQTLLDNAHLGIVTIINEADALSDVELMKLRFGGDNDGLASHLARSIGVSSLTIFAKMGGIFDEQKELIPVVDTSNIDIVRAIAATRDTSTTGRGGLSAKVEACWQSAQSGVRTRIAATSKDMSGINATEFVVG